MRKKVEITRLVQNHIFFDFTIFANYGFREAPPTKKPSTSLTLIKS